MEWDRTSFSLKENFRILGTFVNSAGKSYSGSVQSLFQCNEDPLVLPQAACNGVAHNHETGAKFSAAAAAAAVANIVRLSRPAGH